MLLVYRRTIQRAVARITFVEVLKNCYGGTSQSRCNEKVLAIIQFLRNFRIPRKTIGQLIYINKLTNYEKVSLTSNVYLINFQFSLGS